MTNSGTHGVDGKADLRPMRLSRTRISRLRRVGWERANKATDPVETHVHLPDLGRDDVRARGYAGCCRADLFPACLRRTVEDEAEGDRGSRG